MTMKFCSRRFDKCFVALCFVLLACLHGTQGSGHIEVHFLEYSDTCEEKTFFVFKKACDPMFSFCLNSVPLYNGKPVENCNYASTGETNDYYSTTNHVNLEEKTSILGIRNPWVVRVAKFLSPSVLLAVKVTDYDRFVDHYLQTLDKAMTETIWPTKEVSQWVERSMSKNGYQMRFKIRLYCDPDYYTTTCDKYCKVDDPNHGYCHPQTGEKVCHPEWDGDDCNTDRDECELGFCVTGNCTNLPGDYNCDCPPYASGKNCTDACQNQPCQNGGICFAHITEDDYLCKCSGGWEGKSCESEKVPCNQNGR